VGDDEQSGTLPVVGLGASAGGLEALQEFFDHLPSSTGAAFVVVTHQATGHKSMLAELLSRHTTMTVVQPDGDVELAADRIYVPAPGFDVALEDGVLRLTQRHPDAPRKLPIDAFFRSLARERKDHAIGIVLSGGGSDGTLGLKEIAGMGGMVMVQDEESARYASMPQSAMAHLRVDFALPVAELPEMLVRYLERLARRHPSLDLEPPDEFRRILIALRNRSGHDFTHYKYSTMRRRIERRMNVNQTSSYAEYAELLQSRPEEVERLFQELLIGVTSFFRDPESFETLRESLRAYLQQKPPEFTVRVWINGCSTGEEAYSIAMLLSEVSDALNIHFDAQVFATDLDPESIEVARAGLYPAGVMADLGDARLQRFFTEEDGAYRVRKELREKIVFAPQNMIADPPFTRLDLIVCRNVLIYLKSELQRRVLPMFHYALRPGGLLFLGPSETATGLEHLFEAVDRKWKIFRRREPAPGAPAVHVPPVAGAVRTPGVAAPRRPEPPRALVERVLLREAMPPSVVVDRHGNIVHVHGRTGAFLEPAPGAKEEANLFSMAREGLSTELAIALRRADQNDEIVHHRTAKVRSNGGWNAVSLRVQKLTQSEQYRGLFVVSFERVEPIDPADVGAPSEATDQSRLSDMEAELRSAKEIHQETAEELETANEELKSANEELQSTNEELQSTNEELETSREELQSLNEELQTVNAELQSKVEELSRANDDLRNLLNSTDIATIFLDAELNIKRYTERAKRVVRLIPSDIGRPISDLVAALEYDREIIDDAREVLDTLVFKEAEVRSKDGRWYLMRILPYRTTENVIEGLVITFVDLTGVKTLEHHQARIVAALSTSPTTVFGQDQDLRYVWTCDGVFGVAPDKVVGKTDAELLSPSAARELTDIKRRVLETGARARAQLLIPVGGAQKLHDVFLEPLRAASGEVRGVSGVITVIDDSTKN
jgi:two-component system CheB/CheR fusion protein